MGKKKKNEELKLVVTEFKVSMYCNACERTVARAISEFKGVEKFTTDMNKHKVVVTGRIDPQKVLKKLKKKTEKRVEIIVKEESPESEGDEEAINGAFAKPEFECCIDNEVLTMFSDENPNAACCIM